MLAVALSGIHLGNAVLGIAAAAGDLPDVALGIANYAIWIISHNLVFFRCIFNY